MFVSVIDLLEYFTVSDLPRNSKNCHSSFFFSSKMLNAPLYLKKRF